jgi:predicted  nucleic acid-binding Zn-ribbon protein
MIARVTRAVYWFNPLAWWAVRRLDLELELACDEEVLALGTRASSYACHLLGIAHSLVRSPAPAISGLEMARRTHLEERIMTILKKTTHRKAGITVLLPAAILVAAMVPALAAVYPTDPEPRPASAELKQVMTEMREVEERMEPHLAKIEKIEIDMEPQLAMIADMDIDIDDEEIARIELQMQPYLAQLEEISIDMEPFHEQIEAMEQEMQKLQIHIEDGTLEEVQFQIQEQVTKHMEMIEEIHIDMGPYMEQIEEIHAQLEPLHEAMAEIHIDLEPMHEEMQKIHISIEPFHEQMEALHEELEPFHEELERLGNRLEAAIGGEVVAVLREHLATVTAPGTSFDEAAARIVEDAHIHVDDDLVSIDASRDDVRDILVDLFAPQRVGTQDVFDAAIEATVDALSPLEIRID